MTFEEMSKEALVAALKEAQADLERARSAVENERLVHDLQVHQIELEMQNRELREAQATIEEARSRYADLYDFAPVAYCTLEKDGRIIEANLSATAYFGRDRSALIGKPLSTIVVPDDRQALRNHLRRCTQDKTRVTTELRMAVEGLGPTSFQLVSTPVIAEGGAVSGCKTAITDISQLKRSEERLQLLADASLTLARSFDLEENLSKVVHSVVPAAADLCFADVYGDSGEVSRVAVAVSSASKNAVAEAMRRPPVPRTTLTDPLLVSDDPGGVLSHAIGDGTQREPVIQACAPRSAMLVPIASKGKVTGLLGMVTTADSGRRFSGADLVFARDLAARAAMAIENATLFRASERSREVRQEILSIVSHELKTPLTAISLGAGALMVNAPAAEQRSAAQHVTRIKRGITHMQRLIDDLHDFSSLETGRLSSSPRPVPLDALLQEAVELLASIAIERKLSLEVVPGAPLAALCDDRRVLQVLANLIGNALKFTPEGGKISVFAELVPGERMVQLTVRDTGPGLPKQVMRNLFTSHWQPKETTSKTGGMGLFISKGIVEAQGGAIWVESQAKEGTSFKFTLPRAELDQAQQPDGDGDARAGVAPSVAGSGQAPGLDSALADPAGSAGETAGSPRR